MLDRVDTLDALGDVAEFLGAAADTLQILADYAGRGGTNWSPIPIYELFSSSMRQQAELVRRLIDSIEAAPEKEGRAIVAAQRDTAPDE